MAKVATENSSFIVVFIPQTSEQAVVLPVVPFPSCIVESVESTNNSPAALEQAVARASSVMHRVMEERVEQERWRREMNRREREIRTQRAKERMGREARKVVEANKWPQQHGAVTGPGCTSLHEMVSSFHFSIFFRVNSYEGLVFLSPPLISQIVCCQDTSSAREEFEKYHLTA